jgi:protein-tyrosine phosphatase
VSSQATGDDPRWADAGRRRAFERWWNVRDLGALPTSSGGWTREGLVWRATVPRWTTAADVERALGAGVAGLIDLRGPEAPTGELHRRVPHRRYDVSGGAQLRPGASAAEQLPRYLEPAGEVLASAVADTIRGSRTGTQVVHCNTGKDRTGLLVVLLLELAQVDRAATVADYVASEPEVAAMRGHFRRSGWQLSGPRTPSYVHEPCRPEVAEAVLAELDRLGGARAYLLGHGIDGSLLDEWRARAVVPGQRR